MSFLHLEKFQIFRWIGYILLFPDIYFIITGFESNLIIIVVLLQLGWLFDLMDGMMARYKKMGYYHPDNPSNKGYYFPAQK